MTDMTYCATHKRRRHFQPFLAFSFLAFAAYAETEPTVAGETGEEQVASLFGGQKLVIIADEKARNDATSYAKAFQSSLEEKGVNLEVTAFLSSSGSFALSVGSLEADICADTVAELVTVGIVPQDTSCSPAEGFVALFRLEAGAFIPVVGHDFTSTEADDLPSWSDDFVESTNEEGIEATNQANDRAEQAEASDPGRDDVHTMDADTRKLGDTIVELGSLSERGFWLYTDLAAFEQQGWVKDASGATASVELRPLDPESESPSLLSLDAMLMLDLPLGQPSQVGVLVRASDDPAREFSEADTPDAFRSAPPELSRPFVQVGTFAVEANALATRDMMQKAGVPVEIKPARINDKPYWRVVVGPAEDAEARRKLLEQIHNKGFTDAFAVAR